MVKKILKSNNTLPYSRAIIHNDNYTMEIAGQIGLKNGILVEGIENQTRQAMENVKVILEEAGWKMKNLTKVRIYLTEMTHYGLVNEIYKGFFKDNYPTRVAIAVKTLPLEALIEIDCTASSDKAKK